MKVAIVGVGIAGLSLAFCLQRRGHQILIIEKAHQLRGGGYMIDFLGPGYDAAEKLGLLPELRKIHFPVPYLVWVDGRGKERISQPYKDVRKLLNNRHFNFMRGDLERLLYEQVKDTIEVRFGTTLSTFEHDGDRGDGHADGPVHASFSDGTSGSFDLLVGADGVHSSVRSTMFGDESRFHRFLGYNTAAYVIEHETGIHARRDAFQTLTEPHRQVAIYPFSGNRLVAFFIYEAPRELAAYTHEAAVTELGRVYGDMNWVVPRLLEYSRQAPDIYFDAVAQIEMARWSKGRVTLVGDACQCVSLLAGQGASMAVAGAYTLAEELSKRGGGEGATAGTSTDIGEALTRYERRLKPEVAKRQASGRRIAHWFVPSNRVQLALSSLITRSSTWPVIRTFVRRALNSGSKI